jgi:CRP-like cAMP-binding protein
MAKPPVDNSGTNWLLNALPAAEARRLLRILEPVALTFGQVLHEPGQMIPYVYFPCGGLISLMTPAGEGKSVEVGVIGREGMVGLPTLLGSGDAPFRAVAQSTGMALRLSAGALQKEVRHSSPLADLLMRYADAFLVQVAQSAACRSLHTVASRYCYWLLMAHDRIGSDQLPFNQKFMALMLAVRLASVTEAAGALRTARLIRYTRGGIHILDRPGLEAACCACYRIIKNRFDRLLVGSPRWMQPPGVDSQRKST